MQNEVAQAVVEASAVAAAGTSIAGFITSAMVSSFVGNVYQGAVMVTLYPAQFALNTATSVATAATTYVVMAAGRLAIAGTCYVATTAATSAVNGVSYLFKPVAPKNEEWDNADAPLTPLSPGPTPIKQNSF